MKDALEECHLETLKKISISGDKHNVFTSIVLIQKLRTIISEHHPEQYPDLSTSFKALLLKLVKERMQHDNGIINHDIIKREKLSFINVLRCWAAANFGDPSSLIENIIDLQAAVDYGHPQGDEAARDTMAEALSPWYNLKITRDNVLFVSSSAEKIVSHCLRYYLISQNPEEILGKAYSKESKAAETQRLIIYLKERADNYLIVDESLLERTFQEKLQLQDYSIVNEVLRFYPEAANRIIIIRSSGSIFTLESTFILVIISFDAAIQAKFLEESISISGHAPRSLQRAYSQSLRNYTRCLKQSLDPIVESSQDLKFLMYKSNLNHFYELLIKGIYRERLKNIVSPIDLSERDDTPEDFLFLPQSSSLLFAYDDTGSNSPASGVTPSLTPNPSVPVSPETIQYSPDTPTILKLIRESSSKI